MPILCDVAGALRYMHLQNIFHLDINPRNLLLAHDGSPVRGQERALVPLLLRSALGCLDGVDKEYTSLDFHG